MQWRNWRNYPCVTAALVAVNIIVFLICCIDGGRLYELGVMDAESVLGGREYGRLLWCTFLHSDFPHIFNNMVILFFLGSMIEQGMGHLPYGVIYFLSGLGGSILSLYMKYVNADPVGSLGASGAVFGLDGLLLAMVLFPGESKPAMDPRRVIFAIALSLYNGFTGENIDNAAHVGGLIMGFLAGAVYFLIIRRKKQWNKED